MAVPAAPRPSLQQQQQRSASFNGKAARSTSHAMQSTPSADLSWTPPLSSVQDTAAEDSGEIDAVSDIDDTGLDLHQSGRHNGSSGYVLTGELGTGPPPIVNSTAPLQPRRPPLPVNSSSSSLRSLRSEALARPASPFPLSRPDVMPPSADTMPANAASLAAPETPKEQLATAESLINHVLSLKRIAPGRGTPLGRTVSETSATAISAAVLPRRESHTRHESNGSATDVEEELDRQRAMQEMARSTSASSLSANRSRVLQQSENSGLESVDLSHKRMAELPAGVIQLLVGHAERLALGYNHLMSLPAELSLLGTTLRYLNIRVNGLTVFPAVLCELPSLEILDISRNKIVKLPKSAGTLQNLKVLSLSKNRLIKLPTWVSQMHMLRVLKIDHNPIVHPPREITTLPAEATVPGDEYERRRAKSDDPLMAAWIVRIKSWLAENASDHKVLPRSLIAPLEEETQSEAEGLAVPAPQSQSALAPVLVAAASAQTHLPGSDTPKASRSRAAAPISSAISSAVSPSAAQMIPRAGLGASIDVSTPLSEGESVSKPVNHVRNASTSTADDPAPSRPSLRPKKSLPDMRQSHAQILDDRIVARHAEGHMPRLTLNLAAARRPRADSMASPGVSAFSPQLQTSHRSTNASASYFDIQRSQSMAGEARHVGNVGDGPRTSGDGPVVASKTRAPVKRSAADTSDEARQVGVARNSGAYFRRLSMLPASSIAKSVPSVLLHFVDAARGILFALSQLHSALKHFVLFATPDRLPAALARMMSSADASMSSLIDALDRFDSSTRRSTPTSGIVREVFNACRDNVAAFGKLVGVLGLQLKILTAAADIRYTRTLLLMLHGSMAEVAAAWSIITPLVDDLRNILVAPGDRPVNATLSAQLTAASVKPDDPSISPAASSVRAPPLGPPVAAINGRHRQKSAGRRHAGSFSAEDITAGATLPQHSPQNSFTGTLAPHVAAATPASASVKPRPGMPKLHVFLNQPQNALAPGSMQHPPVLQDFLKHLNDLPPTPIASVPPASVDGNVQKMATALSTPQVTTRPMTPAVNDGGVMDDFLDMIDSTARLALSVCSMLTERTTLRRFSELNDLCEVGADMAKRLKEDLGMLPGGEAVLSNVDDAKMGATRWRAVSGSMSVANCKMLWEDSNAFAKAVIQIVSLARAVAQEALKTNEEQAFAEPAREGMSQLAKMTNTLLSIAAVAVKPRS